MKKKRCIASMMADELSDAVNSQATELATEIIKLMARKIESGRGVSKVVIMEALSRVSAAVICNSITPKTYKNMFLLSLNLNLDIMNDEGSPSRSAENKKGNHYGKREFDPDLDSIG